MKLTNKYLKQLIRESLVVELNGPGKEEPEGPTTPDPRATGLKGAEARKRGLGRTKEVATGRGVDDAERELMDKLGQTMLNVAKAGTSLKTGRLKTLYDKYLEELERIIAK